MNKGREKKKERMCEELEELHEDGARRNILIKKERKKESTK